MSKLPEKYEDPEQSEQNRISRQVQRSLVQYLYEVDTKKQNPLLREVNGIPHGVTRRWAVEYAEDTWERDIIPSRQCLIRLERFVQSLPPPRR